MTTMLSTRIPFAGFYGTIWEDLLDREAESWIEHVGEEPSRYDPALVLLHDRGELGELLFDFTKFRVGMEALAKDYAEAFVDWLANNLSLDSIIWEYEEMTSPAYYNFETDRLFAKLELPVFEAIFAYLDEHHPSAFGEAVRRAFTSRDGFSSYYDNDPDALRAKPLEEWDHNELSVLLTALIATNDKVRQHGSLDMILYHDLDEAGYRAWDTSVDFDGLTAAAQARAQELRDDGSLTEDEEHALVSPRCSETFELPLG